MHAVVKIIKRIFSKALYVRVSRGIILLTFFEFVKYKNHVIAHMNPLRLSNGEDVSSDIKPMINAITPSKKTIAV